ncbi:MAG: hypothetical protein QOE65_2169 [Solirubrobacteraceae bacterium]|nr:hypothetical protein [Solirubrobacteraceae bacterium]
MQDTTPPLAGTPAATEANGQSFAACPSAAFPHLGRFALQEPFNDQNGNGQWDANVDIAPVVGDQNPPTATGPPEPYCDANGNGHWDGIYSDKAFPATGVHDRLEARAIALSDGQHKPVVYVTLSQIGIFDYYTDQVRAILAGKYSRTADVVVSANHNESSPDSIGLYGAGQTGLGAGTRSGIDEYYMSFLEDRAAHAAADALANLQPATLHANQIGSSIPPGLQGSSYPLLTGMSERISDQFPTAVKLAGDDRVAAVDPKLGVLQARRPDGSKIFTAVTLAAHNQEMGNAGQALSGDWPGAMERSLDAAHEGVGVFLVADNGSEEDPQTSPTVIDKGSENHTNQATQYVQAQATGQRLAQIAADAGNHAQELNPGTVRLTRKQVCIPLENNAFVGLGAGGVFGKRQGYVCDPSGNPIAPAPNGFAAPNASTQFRSFLSYADVGPDLQIINNPGEAFPALMVGSPFGKETESCDRPNPAVPSWHARAPFRFQTGLADDMIGYLIPAWGFASGVPGLFSTDSCYADMNGHGHKLESESIGPTGSNMVADGLSGLLDAQKDPSAHIVQGRFLLPDGTYSHWPTGRDNAPAGLKAVGILIPAAGATGLDPNAGLLIGAPDLVGMGARAVDATGVFMDYNGQPQPGPDVTTRGMMLFGSNGCVSARYYLNVFPTLDQTRKLGTAATGPEIVPNGLCTNPGAGGIPPVQIGAGVKAGVLPSSAAGALSLGAQQGLAATARRQAARCASAGPLSTFDRGGVRVRNRRLLLHGRARRALRTGCRFPVRRVTVFVYRKVRGGCRFLAPDGRVTRTRTCRRPILLRARGTARWSLSLRLASLPRGIYGVVVRATDSAGRTEFIRRPRNNFRLRVASPRRPA